MKKYPQALKQYGRVKRILFPSPAERKFVEIVGWGWLFIHGVRREYPVSGYVVDFANPRTKCCIEIDGKKFHDIVSDYDRDERLRKAGWGVVRIPAHVVFGRPKWTRDTARRWLK